jgi:hypothetical protein
VVVIGTFLGAFVAAGWAWRYQHRALRLLHPVTIGGGARSSDVSPGAAMTLPPTGATRMTCNSVLGWESFAVTSVLTLDQTVLVGCRRLDDQAGDIQTMVLLIGDDERSGRAIAMLDGWCRSGARLRLRPTEVCGAIELREDDRAVLRAPLLVA